VGLLEGLPAMEVAPPRRRRFYQMTSPETGWRSTFSEETGQPGPGRDRFATGRRWILSPPRVDFDARRAAIAGLDRACRLSASAQRRNA